MWPQSLFTGGILCIVKASFTFLLASLSSFTNTFMSAKVVEVCAMILSFGCLPSVCSLNIILSVLSVSPCYYILHATSTTLHTRSQQDLECEIIAFYAWLPWYFPKYFMYGFQIWILWWPWTESLMYQPMVSDCGSIFKVTAGLNMSKYCIFHFVSMIVPKVFYQWLSNVDK